MLKNDFLLNILTLTLKVAYSLTSRGDLSNKLNYAFDLYDTDGNGSLTSAEIKSILHAMLDLLVIS